MRLACLLAPLILAGCSEFGLEDQHPSNDLPDTDAVVDVPDDTADTTDPIDTQDTQDTQDTGVPPVPGEPVAVAGADREVNPPICTTTNAMLCLGAERENILDGSASYDPAGLAITEYKWSIATKPSDSHALMLMSTNKQPMFFFDVAGTYDFALTVKNSGGVWDSTPDHIIVVAKPSRDFYVQLTWDQASDLDLHVLRNNGALYDNTNDVSYCHQDADWGVPSNTTDNPSLDWDSIAGYGPETTTIQAPAAGTYAVKVVYYGLDGNSECRRDADSTVVDCPDSTATVKVFYDGVEVDSFTHTLTESSQVWYVTDIGWPGATITEHDTVSTTTQTSCF